MFFIFKLQIIINVACNDKTIRNSFTKMAKREEKKVVNFIKQ